MEEFTLKKKITHMHRNMPNLDKGKHIPVQEENFSCKY